MKIYYYPLGVLQAFIALGAIPAATLFLMDTSGSGMGNSTEMLANSPFRSFLIPALFLLIVNGFGSVAGAIYSFLKKPFAGPLGLVLGIILMMWIILQVYWIGYSSFLQPMFLIVGFLEAFLGWLIIRKRP